MPVVYEFTEIDFQNATSINLNDFQAEVKASDIVSTVEYCLNEYINSTDFKVSIVFNESLSAPDLIILTNIVNDYVFQEPRVDTICYIKEVQSPGTNGGTFTSGTWQKRTLNTLIGNVDFATINNSQITLQPNTYIITVNAPACDVQDHQIRLQNITDATTQDPGLGSYSSGGITTYSTLNTTFTLDAVKVFEIQHICYLSSSNIGFGKANGWGDEIYTTVSIQKTS